MRTFVTGGSCPCHSGWGRAGQGGPPRVVGRQLWGQLSLGREGWPNGACGFLGWVSHGPGHQAPGSSPCPETLALPEEFRVHSARPFLTSDCLPGPHPCRGPERSNWNGISEMPRLSQEPRGAAGAYWDPQDSASPGLSFLICQISPSQSQAYGVLRRPNRVVCVRHPANPPWTLARSQHRCSQGLSHPEVEPQGI